MRATRGEDGNFIIALSIELLVLIMFAGLTVNAGMAYITKARLSKAVDAACLTGMKALPQGQAVATQLATHIFNANYGPNAPAPTITFPTDSYGDQQVSVSGSLQVPTIFAPYMFSSWQVSDTAVSTRGKLVMALILDRSGSMQSDGGATALKSAVPAFVNQFNNTLDEVAMISFASNSSVNFAINTNFQTPITNAVKSLNFNGATFGTGGTFVSTIGPPLTLADNEIGSVAIQPGQNVTRVAVYFTDGKMNTIQDTLNCSNSPPGHTLYNFGGYDSGSTFDFFNPTTGNNLSSSYGCGGHGLTCSGFPPYSSGTDCHGITTFYSQSTSTQVAFSRTAITADAQFRALQTANAMRAETPGTYVYVIGLGGSVDATTQAFLRQLANDPASTSYNPNLPEGLFLYVPDCPSTTCTAELQTAFQTIASKILLRLTQ
ncbi:MAG TPA: VWA domain-containing protein [Candidatus Bathyarchaeia archaeon]|nr:VWA domain-containing protein [Candidatus Bathyarchaeia archaeon]